MPRTEASLRAAIVAYVAAQRASVRSADDLDVALDVLREAFGVSAGDAPSEDLLAVWTSAAAPPEQPAPAARDPVEESSLFTAFLANVSAKGFFDGAAKGSPEYETRLAKALAKFKERQAAAAAPAAAAPAAPAAAPAGDEAAAEAAREEGNQHFKAGRMQQAIEAYTDAIERAPDGASVHLYFNNRAAARLSLRDYDGAAADAASAVARQPDFAKGYVRLATALQFAGRCVGRGATGGGGLGGGGGGGGAAGGCV